MTLGEVMEREKAMRRVTSDELLSAAKTIGLKLSENAARRLAEAVTNNRLADWTIAQDTV
jgi:post-segregation antitoxin (ccd killing protein)